MKKETLKRKNELNQIELMPLPRGGKREGAGRKPIAQELKKPKTVVIRVDEKLLQEIEKLKNGEKISNSKNDIKKEEMKKLIEEIMTLRNDAEHLESKRKSDDLGQFGKIIDMDIKLISLKSLIEEL